MIFGVCAVLSASTAPSRPERVPGEATRQRPPTDFTLQELWRVGGINARPEAEFGGPMFVTAFGRHGEATILDQSQARVSVFDGRSGAFVHAFARPGRGPGELSSPGAMTWDPLGHLWIANSFNGWYTVFDSTGDFIKVVKRSGHAVARISYPMVVTSSGTIVDHISSYPDLRFIVQDTAGSILNSLRVMQPLMDSLGAGPIRPGSAIRDVVWLRPRSVWSLARDGQSIWLTRSDSLRLLQLSLSGDTIRDVRTTHRVAEFTREQREAIRRANQEIGRSAKFTPILVQAVHALEDGRVLVQIGNTMAEPGREFELFDPRGNWLGTVHAPFRVSHRSELASRGDTLLLAALGELDAPLLIKAVLKPVR